MRKRGKTKTGAIELSFGMIFSLILIAFFLAAAFYAVKKFIDFQNDLKIAQFKDDLQKDIDDLWRSAEGSYQGKYSLPTYVKSVCFVDDPYDNLIFNPNTIQGKLISHIDIAKTTAASSDKCSSGACRCFDNTSGKITIFMHKNYGDNMVTISNE